MRAPVASSTAQRIRRSQGTGTRVLKCDPRQPPGMEPISSEPTSVESTLPQPEMQEAGDAGQNHGMHDVGARPSLWAGSCRTAAKAS